MQKTRNRQGSAEVGVVVQSSLQGVPQWREDDGADQSKGQTEKEEAEVYSPCC